MHRHPDQIGKSRPSHFQLVYYILLPNPTLKFKS